MAPYNTVPAAEDDVQKPKSLKQIIVAAAVTSFVLGAACAEIASYSAQTGATRLDHGPKRVLQATPSPHPSPKGDK